MMLGLQSPTLLSLCLFNMASSFTLRTLMSSHHDGLISLKSCAIINFVFLSCSDSRFFTIKRKVNKDSCVLVFSVCCIMAQIKFTTYDSKDVFTTVFQSTCLSLSLSLSLSRPLFFKGF